MFQIGKTYVFYEVEPAGGTGRYAAEVIEWAPPLLKIKDPALDFVILNVNSMLLHKVEASRHETYETPEPPAKTKPIRSRRAGAKVA